MKRFVKRVVEKLICQVNSPWRLKFFGEPLFWLMGFRRPVARTSPPTNIAVIKLDRLGDLVLCSHLLAQLRRAHPASRITLFVREALVDVARLCRDVDEVIGVPVSEGVMIFIPETFTYHDWNQQLMAWLRLCRKGGFWKRRFDVAVVPRWDTDYYGAVPLAYLMGASQRWGVTEVASVKKAVVNRGFDQLLTNVIDGQIVGHEFLLNNEFVSALGFSSSGDQKLKSWAEPAEQLKAREIMTAMGVIFSKPVVVVCLGAGAPNRMLPVDHYAKLFSSVLDFEKMQLVTFGASSEKSLGMKLRELLGDAVVNLEGVLPLDLLPAAISLGKLYVGSDTGTMHLAVAAGLPVFEISCHPIDGDPNWAESPIRFGPWAVPHCVLQPEHATVPCGKFCGIREAHCILGITDEKLADSLRSFLKEIGMGGVCEVSDEKN